VTDDQIPVRRGPGWRVARWVDDRLHASRFASHSLDKIFPDHWSFMLGEIAMYSFVVLLVTGVYLTLFYVPSVSQVVYTGKYVPLRGLQVSQAYASTLNLSFQVRSGLVMRQMHHWAAIVFIGAMVVHLARVFFTGAFRRPREINWIVGVSMLILGIVNGFAGYSLPDDLLSGTGLRVAYSIMESIPIGGTWLAFLIFGGKYPSTDIISRLYVIHILIIPAAIVGLLSVHLAIMWHQKHTQFKGRGRTEDNVVGVPMWPTFAAKSTGFMFMITGIIAALGGLAQINPVWLYGPYQPYQVSSASQPDWYMGWLDGALRIFPNWEIHAFGHSVGNLFFPGVLLPGITFGLLFAWPWLEAHFSKDREVHHLCDRPRDAPVRTGFGVAAIAFYAALFAAGGTDVIAVTFDVSENNIIWALRVAVIVLPVVCGYIAYRLCKELAAVDAGRRRPPAVITRSAGGGYTAVEAVLEEPISD
jgi:ubiquinol-cytochrome c reductase cytochrome b subunit